MINEYCIGLVGVKNGINYQSIRTITHDRIKYELLIDTNATRLISGIDNKMLCKKHRIVSVILFVYRCTTLSRVLF